MYILDEAVPGRLPRHEGSWGVRVTKKCKDKDGNRVEQTIMDKTGEIPMSNEMRTPNQAMAGLSRGLTLSLGNFETARADVWVAIPCNPDDAALEAAYARGKAFCESKLEEAVTEIRGKSE
jgi:hypothetical protein